MKASRFNLSIPGFPGAGKNLLYNTRSQAQVVVDDELSAAIQALPVEPGKPETETALAQLAKMGFLVDSSEDDDRALESLFRKVRQDDTVLRPTVLTTYSCNFACTYCVEEGVRDPVFMDEAMARRAVDYIIERFREFGSRQMTLSFYGGEPLLNMPAIRIVAGSLRDFTNGIGAPFGFALSTNGSLFTVDVIRELKPLGLAGAKITLDGPRETHDRSRPFGNGKGSFDLLMGIVRSAVELTNITIEINFDDGNLGHIPRLLDSMVAEGLHTRIKQLVFSPISRVPKDREGLRPATEISCSLLTIESARRQAGLQALAAERGFPLRYGVYSYMCDMTMKRSSFIIDPRGDLYRCGGLAGRRDFAFGNLDGRTSDPFLGRELWRRCAECTFAPICGDGCLFGAYVRFGDPLTLNCGKEPIEYLVRENLKLSYLHVKRKQGQ